MTNTKFDSVTTIRHYILLIFGIMLFIGGVSLLPTIWTFKSDLLKLTGTLRSATTYVNTVTDRHGHPSQVSTLNFYLNEQQKKFHLVENIGDKFLDEKYERISNELKQSDSVFVWIAKRDKDEYAPEVFQIENERSILLDYETVRMDKSPMAIFMFVLSLLSIVAFFWIRYPVKFKKVLGIKE